MRKIIYELLEEDEMTLELFAKTSKYLRKLTNYFKNLINFKENFL